MITNKKMQIGPMVGVSSEENVTDTAKRIIDLLPDEVDLHHVIEHQPANQADAIDKLIYLAAILISGREELTKGDLSKVMESIEKFKQP